MFSWQYSCDFYHSFKFIFYNKPFPLAQTCACALRWPVKQQLNYRDICIFSRRPRHIQGVIKTIRLTTSAYTIGRSKQFITAYCYTSAHTIGRSKQFITAYCYTSAHTIGRSKQFITAYCYASKKFFWQSLIWPKVIKNVLCSPLLNINAH